MKKSVIIDGIEYVPKGMNELSYSITITGFESNYEPIYKRSGSKLVANIPVSHYMTVKNAYGEEITVGLSRETYARLTEAIK